jgi:hypothetical protein
VVDLPAVTKEERDGIWVLRWLMKVVNVNFAEALDTDGSAGNRGRCQPRFKSIIWVFGRTGNWEEH